jgi:hypothetical protein
MAAEDEVKECEICGEEFTPSMSGQDMCDDCIEDEEEAYEEGDFGDTDEL